MLGFPLYLLLHKDFSPLSIGNGVPTHPGRASTHMEDLSRAPDIGTKGHGHRGEAGNLRHGLASSRSVDISTRVSEDVWLRICRRHTQW